MTLGVLQQHVAHFERSTWYLHKRTRYHQAMLAKNYGCGSISRWTLFVMSQTHKLAHAINFFSVEMRRIKQIIRDVSRRKELSKSLHYGRDCELLRFVCFASSPQFSTHFMVLVNFNPTLTKIASETKLIINAKQQTRNQGGAGGAKPLQENFLPPLEKCVGYSLKLLDIVQKIWAPLKKKFGSLSENSSSLLVSQAGYGPAKQ